MVPCLRAREARCGSYCSDRLTAGEHGVEAVGAEDFHDDVALIALELDHTVLGRAADAAALLQAARQRTQLRLVERHPGDGRDRLAAPPSGLAADLHPAAAAGRTRRLRLRLGRAPPAQVALAARPDEVRVALAHRATPPAPRR